MATSSLSVETWQTILRYSISAPEFLDADVFVGVSRRDLIVDKAAPRNDEAAYWHAERTRNKLQLVCMSWNKFLSSFEHRYVRMVDIRHGKIESKTLKKAIRVAFGRSGCKCQEYCQDRGAFNQFSSETVQGIQGMAMEIADMRDSPQPIPAIMGSPNFQDVKTLAGPGTPFCCSLAELLCRVPAICHLYTREFIVDPFSGEEIISGNLVTLSFELGSQSAYGDVVWKLPALRYLRLTGSPTQFQSLKSDIVHILRAVGPQLHSFHVHQAATPADALLREIWDLCPNLEELGTDLPLDQAPPHSHPIRTVTVYYKDQLRCLKPLPEWPNVPLITVECFQNLRGLKWMPTVVPR